MAELVRLAEDPETGSLGARVCAAKALALTAGEGEGREDKAAAAVKIVSEGFGGRGVTVPGCVAAMEAVAGIAGEPGAVEALREACAGISPLAEAFGAAPAGDAPAVSPGPAAPWG